MDFTELQAFLDDGLARWGEIRESFANDAGLAAFLKKSKVEVMFDSLQFEDVNLARTLYIEKKDKKAEEQRRKMAMYFEKDVRDITLEISFPSVNIEFIQEVKAHPLIQGLNSQSKASIRATINRTKVKR